MPPRPSHNPFVLSYALFTYGLTYRDADPVRAPAIPRAGPGYCPKTAGNRANETHSGCQSGPT